MQMMYNVVAKELKSMQLSDVHPQDYLNFYCLGNREHFNEESSGSNSAPVISPNKNSILFMASAYHITCLLSISKM
jgi:phospholipase D1/2